MIISKDANSEWSMQLITNKGKPSLVLFKGNTPMITPIEITSDEAETIKSGQPVQKESLECEYKFLVKNENWKDNISHAESYKQLYLTKDINKWQSRIRIINDKKALLTVKGPRVGISNIEVEYPIDLKEALHLWNIHEGVRLSKERSVFIVGDEKWEVDVFTDPELVGLQLVEIELPTEDTHIKFIPDWVGEDVTEVGAFRNDSLANYVFEKKTGKNNEDIFEIVGNIHNKSKMKL